VEAVEAVGDGAAEAAATAAAVEEVAPSVTSTDILSDESGGESAHAGGVPRPQAPAIHQRLAHHANGAAVATEDANGTQVDDDGGDDSDSGGRTDGAATSCGGSDSLTEYTATSGAESDTSSRSPTPHPTEPAGVDWVRLADELALVADLKQDDAFLATRYPAARPALLPRTQLRYMVLTSPAEEACEGSPLEGGYTSDPQLQYLSAGGRREEEAASHVRATDADGGATNAARAGSGEYPPSVAPPASVATTPGRPPLTPSPTSLPAVTPPVVTSLSSAELPPLLSDAYWQATNSGTSQQSVPDGPSAVGAYPAAPLSAGIAGWTPAMATVGRPRPTDAGGAGTAASVSRRAALRSKLDRGRRRAGDMVGGSSPSPVSSPTATDAGEAAWRGPGSPAPGAGAAGDGSGNRARLRSALSRRRVVPPVGGSFSDGELPASRGREDSRSLRDRVRRRGSGNGSGDNGAASGDGGAVSRRSRLGRASSWRGGKSVGRGGTAPRAHSAGGRGGDGGGGGRRGGHHGWGGGACGSSRSPPGDRTPVTYIVVRGTDFRNFKHIAMDLATRLEPDERLGVRLHRGFREAGYELYHTLTGRNPWGGGAAAAPAPTPAAGTGAGAGARVGLPEGVPPSAELTSSARPATSGDRGSAGSAASLGSAQPGPPTPPLALPAVGGAASTAPPLLPPGGRLRIVGHSLGGAAGILLALLLQADGYTVDAVTAVGAPRLTDPAGAAVLADALPGLLRVAAYADVVRTLPPGVRYRHFGRSVLLHDDGGVWEVPTPAPVAEPARYWSAGAALRAHRTGHYCWLVQRVLERRWGVVFRRSNFLGADEEPPGGDVAAAEGGGGGAPSNGGGTWAVVRASAPRGASVLRPVFTRRSGRVPE